MKNIIPMRKAPVATTNIITHAMKLATVNGKMMTAGTDATNVGCRMAKSSSI